MQCSTPFWSLCRTTDAANTTGGTLDLTAEYLDDGEGGVFYGIDRVAAIFDTSGIDPSTATLYVQIQSGSGIAPGDIRVVLFTPDTPITDYDNYGKIFDTIGGANDLGYCTQTSSNTGTINILSKWAQSSTFCLGFMCRSDYADSSPSPKGTSLSVVISATIVYTTFAADDPVLHIAVDATFDTAHDMAESEAVYATLAPMCSLGTGDYTIRRYVKRFDLSWWPDADVTSVILKVARSSGQAVTDLKAVLFASSDPLYTATVYHDALPATEPTGDGPYSLGLGAFDADGEIDVTLALSAWLAVTEDYEHVNFAVLMDLDYDDTAPEDADQWVVMSSGSPALELDVAISLTAALAAPLPTTAQAGVLTHYASSTASAPLPTMALAGVLTHPATIAMSSPKATQALAGTLTHLLTAAPEGSVATMSLIGRNNQHPSYLRGAVMACATDDED